jgi:hypothetical protein
VASSGSRHSVSSGIASRDEDIFEVPRTIRFPPAAPTKCYSEVVLCKWELCGNEFESTGKLIDHLKVCVFLKQVSGERPASVRRASGERPASVWRASGKRPASVR